MPRRLISILMPVYNGEAYLRQAMESLLSQSYSDVEVIAVDDGSTDASLKILEEYRRRDARVKVFFQENRGIVRTLNESLRHASGRYIARMDVDDISRPSRLEKQFEYLIQNDLDIVGGGINRFGIGLDKPKIYPETDAEIKASIWTLNDTFAHPTILAKRAVLEENLYQEGFQGIEDMHLWMRLSLKNVRMGNVPDVVLDYRRHSEQATKTKNKKWYADNRVKAMIDALAESDIVFDEDEVSSYYHTVSKGRSLAIKDFSGFWTCMTKILSLTVVDRAVKRELKRKVLASLIGCPSVAGVLTIFRLVVR